MAIRPQYGERYQHIKGWTVRIIRTIYHEDIRDINPEFYCEVGFIYENSDEYTEMPIDWFNGMYRKISVASSYYRQGTPIKRHTNIPDYSWLNDDNE
ncbi:hypothetical protein [Yersinia bercovieri]|uniref:hypothetical protein n=1 Tax=Yersinia bercovieri TaxID=634 RepID=UPI0025AB3F29|nr:hypothetical protein [Yersinia bercovieri]MDN0101536.1 hypothetical protein [Yersinia bercovieri]